MPKPDSGNLYGMVPNTDEDTEPIVQAPSSVHARKSVGEQQCFRPSGGFCVLNNH